MLYFFAAFVRLQVYYYPAFHAARDGPKFAAELTRNLTRPTAWEAVMRIRCSRGLKITSFHGHFFNRRWARTHAPWREHVHHSGNASIEAELHALCR